MSEELEVLRIVAQRLDQSKIVYMISGSMAANLYSVPRMTRDIDIVVELKSIGIDAFVKIFEKDFFVDKDMVREEVARGGVFNLIHKDYVIKIDFILRQLSEFQAMTFTRRRNVIIENQLMWFIAPEDLVLAKLWWAKDSCSEVQLNDARNILRTVKNLDTNHIKDWVAQLGLSHVAQKIGL